MKKGTIHITDDLRKAVADIKSAILSSQYRLAHSANGELLSLYYGIGQYISDNTRNKTWGTGAINAISSQLQKEMPGLRGFSASALKRMRTFYEQWCDIINRPLAVGDLKEHDNPINIKALIIRPLIVGELDLHDFLSLSFTHHSEILAKTSSLEERLFYIRQAVINSWTKDQLVKEMNADMFQHKGKMPNNFIRTMPNKVNALRAISMFSILDSEVKKPHENPSIGIVLCKTAHKAFVEFLLDGYNSPMGVAIYKTPEDIKRLLPSEEELTQLLNESESPKSKEKVKMT